MKEMLTILYLAGGLIFTAVFLWNIHSRLRKIGWLTLVHVLTMLVLSTAAGCILVAGLQYSIHFGWISRLVLLGIGFILVWGVYQLGWARRHPFNYHRDSFETEFCFVGGMASFMGVLFMQVPAVWCPDPVPHWEKNFWDVGLILIIPFLLYKIWDAFTQIPYPNVENPWTFPHRPVNIEHWKWRELGQINFQIAKNLDSEYNLFEKPVLLWIEVPKEQPIGDIFTLMIQERRKNPRLATIQDLGTEYGGEPLFWLLFSIKKVWWKPATWNRPNRYLFPDLSVVQNEVQANDIIVVQRVPFSFETQRSGVMYAMPNY
jgi:Type VI secretion system, TssN